METAMNKVMTMESVVEEIQKYGENMAVRKSDGCAKGEAPHQGDVYLHRVADNHPRGEEIGTRQVAVGTTVGSRHIVVGSQLKVFAGKALPEWVKAPEWCQQGDLLGPVVVAGESFTLTHPEHAHHELPKGTYQVTYQADYSSRRRVQD